MVNIDHLSSETSALLPSLTQQLEQLSQQQITSQQIVRLAEEMYWSLIEGSYCSDFSLVAIQLRETLSDITAQWESLLGNWHEQSHQPSPDLPEFPKEWVDQWLSQLQAVKATPMSEAPKNQPTFHIQQVGNLNTGDVTIHGDQVGIQHNYAPEANLAEAASKIRELLQQLDTEYGNTTEQRDAIQQKVAQQAPTVRARVVSAIEKGSKKAIEKLVDHPAAAIAIAVYEGFRETKK